MQHRGVTFIQSVELFFKNYTNFRERSSRSAYWWWVLAGVIIGMAITWIDVLVFKLPYSEQGPTQFVWGLLTLIPGIALTARRLHDVDKSGWWQLIAFTIIGLIPLIIWLATPGDRHPNRFGEDLEAGVDLDKYPGF